MNNHICLNFEKEITHLAGYPYGKNVYTNQVEGKVNFDQTVYIEFPPQIVAIASSFVQGFFEDIVSQVGILGVGNRVIIKAGNEKLRNSIISNLR